MFDVKNARCVHDSGKALLIEAPDFKEAKWIPQSVIHDDSEVYQDGDEGTLVVEDWFAEKEGW